MRFLYKLSSWAEKEPHLPLLPLVSFICGVLLYFNLPFEPSIWTEVLIISLCFIGLFVFKNKLNRLFFAITPLFFILGLFVCSVHTKMTDTVFLEQPIQNIQIRGKIISVLSGLNSSHIVIEPDLIEQENETTQLYEPIIVPVLPKRIQLSIAEQPTFVQNGEYILASVKVLTPPSLPITPFAQNEARTLFYDNIGAIGHAHHIKKAFANNVFVEEKTSWIANLRERIRDILQENLSEENIGIAQALILGDTSQITTSSRILYRDLGISHILSVSGFHIGLVAFFVFGFFQFIFNLLPESISTVFIKRFSAIMALIVSGLYVLLSGANPPALRAYIMVWAIFSAIFFDKRAISIRSLYIAAFLLLCYRPVLLMSISFQLSFIAVLCLIGIYIFMKPFFKGKNFIGRILLLFIGYCLLNLIVTLVTAPFVLYTFHQIPMYSVLGNLLFGFIFSFAIIPLLFINVLFIETPLAPHLLFAIDYLLNVVRFIGMPISLLPQASVYVSYFSSYGLVLWSIGLMGFTLFQTKIRFLFLGLMLSFFVAFFTVEKPTAFITAGGQFIGIRIGNTYYETDSFYYKRFHQAWITYGGFNPEKDHIEPLNKTEPAFIAQSIHNCEYAFLSVQKNANMINCPRLITPQQIYEWQSLLIYHKTDNQYTIKRACEIDEIRPWHILCPPIIYNKDLLMRK